MSATATPTWWMPEAAIAAMLSAAVAAARRQGLQPPPSAGRARIRRMKLARIALLLLVAGLLAGCGGGGDSGGDDNGVAEKTADEIVTDATAAAKSASSVYVHGSTTSGDEPLQIDVHLVKDKGVAGHLEANGLSFDIVRVGDKAYFKGDDAFWTQFGGAAAATLFKDKWVQAPADSGDLASLTPLTDISQLFDGILGEHGTLEKGDTTDVDGTSA